MFIKLVRLGRDAEVRYTAGQNPTPVASLAMAYDIGRGDQKRTQWIEAALWGDRAEKLQQYLLKGTQLVATLDEIELDQFQKNDGTAGAKLKARVAQIQFVGGANSSSQQQPQQQPQQQQQQQPGGFDHSFDDDIPF